jgi:hypothetical protein
MMQAAMMLSAQSFAVRDNRRTFLPEFSVAELNSNPAGAITRLALASPALALGDGLPPARPSGWHYRQTRTCATD